MTYYRLLVMLLIVFFLQYCTASKPEDFDLGNTIFPEAHYLIETGIPGFDEKTNSMPSFTWKVTGQRYVYLAIFKNNIIVQSNRIQNIKDNVWAWHSGLGTGREGWVQFGDGRNVTDGVLQLNLEPTELLFGESYYWAVWAWDDEGKIITHSSQEMFFIVENIEK